MKIYNTLVIMLGMMIFLQMLGLGFSTGTEILGDAGIVINNSDVSQSTLDVGNSNWKDLLFNSAGGLLVGLGLALAIGFLTKTFDRKLVVLPFVTAYLVLFISFGTGIFALASGTGESWLSAIVITVWGLISAMFVWSIIEWFGGVE